MSSYGKQIATTAAIGVFIALSVGLGIYYANPAAHYSPASSSSSTNTNTQSASSSSSSHTTTYTSIDSTSTSFATVTSATTLSYSKSGSALSIDYVAVNISSCNVYQFSVNVTESNSGFGDGPPFHYVWNFGDNGTWWIHTNSSSIEHTYTSGGNYQVGLYVSSTPDRPTGPVSTASETFVVAVQSSGC